MVRVGDRETGRTGVEVKHFSEFTAMVWRSYSVLQNGDTIVQYTKVEYFENKYARLISLQITGYFVMYINFSVWFPNN